jgi:hypothetical protein
LFGVEAMSILEILVAPVLIGVGTGAFTSWKVARRFYRKALLDDCSRLLRRLCPYRKANDREADGLNETSWALKIQSEIMGRWFRKEALEIEALSREIGSVGEVESAPLEARQDRDALKETWKKRVQELY